MKTLLEFIADKDTFRHHAILLFSNYFSDSSLEENNFKSLVQEFCGIKLYENPELTAYEIANQHPDIFVADRERKILRLEDIKPIQDFSLYPPQIGKRRLFLIENCERLNINAANSLLKVLEEPPTNCLFLMTTCKLSLVLPTIASRVQKIALAFPGQDNKTEVFQPEHREWMQKQIQSMQLKNKNQDMNSSQPLADIIAHCEKLAKEYEANELRGLLVTLLSEEVKKNEDFLNTARFVLANISEWKNSENYHPSSLLWLIRIFLHSH